MERTFQVLSPYGKVLAGVNVLFASILLGLRSPIITTCGGVINPWMCLEAFLLLSLLGLFLIWIVLAFSNNRFALVMMAANISILLLMFASSVSDTWRFTLLRSQYENAVQFIKTGQLASEASHLSNANEGLLPPKYGHLSACDGRILTRIDGGVQYVFFYNMVDWLSFSGFLYSSDGKLPGDGFFYTTSRKEAGDICKPIETNWYFCQFFD